MRLSRTVSRRAAIVRAFALALVLAALALPAMLYGPNLPFKIISGVFGMVSLLLFWTGIHQLFALRTPETLVDIDVHELERGGEVQLRFRQPGTESYESLRANLVGEERWTERGYSHRVVRKVRQLGTFHLFDSGPFQAPFDQTVRVRIPDLPHAEKTHGEYWRLEVWGKVRGRADFQHVYDLRVQRSASR